MIYTIIHKKSGEILCSPTDDRPIVSNDPEWIQRPLGMTETPDDWEIRSFTNVELLELWIRVQELRRYLNSEKFSKEEWVDRKDVLTRLGLY